LSIEKLIADRISNSRQNKGSISKPIVKIGIIGITVGVSVMLLTVSIVLGFKKEIINKITGLTTHIVISSINRNASNEPEPISLPADTLALLKQLPFVAHIQRTAFKNGLLKTKKENEGILLKGVDQGYDFTFIAKHITSGRLPEFKKDGASKEILVSEVLAKRMDLKLNENVRIYFISQYDIYDSLAKEVVTRTRQVSKKLSICGIFKTNFADFDETLSIVDIKQVQSISYWDSTMVGNYEIAVKDFKNVGEDQEKIEDLLGYNYNVSNVKEIYSSIFIWLDKLDINGVIVVVLMILVATINMITALLILILERTNMVGLVKALGMNNANVRKIFLHISMKLIGRGMLWGNVIGIGLCLLQYYLKIAKLDSETYYVDYVAIEINWYYFLLLNLGTFLTCALMLLLPTLIITKLTPIKTLKFD
jgi:lipoprotein-releasing system permease protein